jgi:hypothetical protein
MNGQYRKTDNTGHTIQRKDKQNTKTQHKKTTTMSNMNPI